MDDLTEKIFKATLYKQMLTTYCVALESIRRIARMHLYSFDRCNYTLLLSTNKIDAAYVLTVNYVNEYNSITYTKSYVVDAPIVSISLCYNNIFTPDIDDVDEMLLCYKPRLTCFNKVYTKSTYPILQTEVSWVCEDGIDAVVNAARTMCAYI